MSINELSGTCVRACACTHTHTYVRIENYTCVCLAEVLKSNTHVYRLTYQYASLQLATHLMALHP